MAESALSLVEQLRAALDRAEEIARAADEMIEGEPWWEAQALSSDGTMNLVDAEFIAANDPSSVLRTVAAHRKILDEYEAVRADTPQDLEQQGAHAQMLIVVRLLAAVYFPEAPDPEPVPPQSVRAVMADGREIPLEVVYAGWDGETHRWDAVVRLGQVPASLKIDVLPARTSVGVRMAQ